MFYDNMMGMNSNMIGMHYLWWVFWIAVVFGLVFWAWGGSTARRDRPRETSHEVLRRRLASGEISTEEYEKRKTVLDRDT